MRIEKTKTRRPAHKPLPNGLAALTLASGLAMITASAASAATPTAEDRKGIEAAIGHYFVAGDTASAAELKKAFHPTAMMFFANKEGRLTGVSMPQWWARTEGAKSPTKALKRAIPMFDVEGGAAIAKVVSDYPTFQFHDYMSLLKFGGEWKIVGKIFHRREPADAPLPTEPEDAAIRASVAAVLGTWNAALDARDPDATAKAGHPRATILSHAEGSVVSVPLAEWQARLAEERDAKKPAPKAMRKIALVDTAPTAAIARVDHDREDGKERVVDYVALVKADGTWRIVGIVEARIERPGA